MNITMFIFTAMNKAKKFLKENLTESKAVAAKTFNVNEKTLTEFIRRDSDEKKEHNKILQNHEINALDDFMIERKSHVSKNQ
jgi:hypothetical protein